MLVLATSACARQSRWDANDQGSLDLWLSLLFWSGSKRAPAAYQSARNNGAYARVAREAWAMAAVLPNRQAVATSAVACAPTGRLQVGLM